ncbi:ABC transporter permease [Bacillus sp. T33-2]|uniref:ABC transporter permease n=1 Tax=Bacillus sp. T33-2 TaxID=2054168 RepID=UPI000C7568E4|nr:ABC transporter permease [Bacillus sp. T33-2]PLR94686.1 ABC transporter permease [Bacillus sp. T33-2]
MNFWWLALKDALLIGRDKKALLTLILMPILLISILGAAFGKMMGGEEETIKKFSVGLVNLDKGALGEVLAEEVFAQGMKDLVSVKSLKQEDLMDQLENQKLTAGFIIDSDFTSSVMSGEAAELKIVSIPGADIQTTIIENVIQQFVQTAEVNATGMQLAVEAAIQAGKPLPEIAEQGPAAVQEQAAGFPLLNEEAVEAEAQQVDSFQYYAAGMGVMFLLMTVVIGVSAMIEEKEQEVYSRLLVSTLTHSQYMMGKFTGLLFMSLIQLMVIILGTSLLFGVDWGNSLSGVALAGIAYVFSACGLGVLIGSFIKTEKAFNVAGMLGTQILSGIGGSMVPLYLFPDWMNGIVQVLPNALALQTFLDLMSGGTFIEVVPEAAILIGMGVLFFAIGWMRQSAERRLSYA